ncbi:unnamed protein product [Closterium sp. NIES-64]|nr:unnamed protein product [Closterium sp. NIES-64]
MRPALSPCPFPALSLRPSVGSNVASLDSESFASQGAVPPGQVRALHAVLPPARSPRLLSSPVFPPSPPQVEYHQDKCEPCMQFAPEVAKVADSLKGLVKVGAINCNKAPDVCMQAQIKELPAFRLYPWEVRANPYTHKRYKDAPQVFTGDNTAKALVSFATAALPHDLVANISSGASADAFLSTNATLNKVVLFSTKPAVTPLFKALSLQFRKRLVFAQAKSTDEALAASFGATSFPALFLHKPDGNRQLYDGPLKPEPIAAFLEQFAAPAEPAADSATAGEAEGGPGGEEGNREECREVKEKFEKTAEELVGMIFVGVVDMHTDEDAKSTGEGAVWRGAAIPLGRRQGGERARSHAPGGSLKAMTAAVYALAPDSFVRHITADSLEVFAQTNPLQPKVGMRAGWGGNRECGHSGWGEPGRGWHIAADLLEVFAQTTRCSPRWDGGWLGMVAWQCGGGRRADGGKEGGGAVDAVWSADRAIPFVAHPTCAIYRF